MACGDLGIDELHKDAHSASKAAAHGRGDGAPGNHLHTTGNILVHENVHLELYLSYCGAFVAT